MRILYSVEAESSKADRSYWAFEGLFLCAEKFIHDSASENSEQRMHLKEFFECVLLILVY